MTSSYFVMSVTMTFLLSVIFGYFAFVQKSKAVGIWSIAWLVSLCRQIIANPLRVEESHNVYLMINEILVILVAILFALGTKYFTNSKFSWKLVIVFVLQGLWSVFCISNNISFIIRLIPIILLLLHSYTEIGMVFILDKDIQSLSKIMLGISFICGGLITVAFVVFVNMPHIIPLLSPWIYLLNSLIAMTMSIGLLDVSYRKQMNELKESEAHYKEAVQNLAKSEEHHRKMIELLPDAVFIHKEREPVMANAAALKLMKCTDIENKYQLYFNIHPDYKEQAEKRLAKLTESETTVDYAEEKFILHNGDIIDVEVGGTSYLYEGEMYLISAVRDISERKKAERLQLAVDEKDRLLVKADEYDKLKTEFFTTISHELKTPLNIILGCVQLLSKIHENNNNCRHIHACLKYIGMMKQNCYRLLRLINNLIDITRLDSGTFKMNFMNYNIVSVIEDITMSVVQFAKSAEINLVFDTEIEEKIICCDADKLERVMLNLLSNAIKFTGPGGTVEVSIKDKGEFAAVSVKDTGIGIPEDKKHLVFERFGQVNSSLTREKEGSGIGLSLVKAIVENHGGSITLESQPDKGSQFTFMLPARTANDTTVNNEAAAAKEVNVERLSIEFSDIYS